MRKLWVGIDLDGVLCDFIWSLTECIRATAPGLGGLPFSCRQTAKWDLSDRGVTREHLDAGWTRAQATPEFLADLPPLISPATAERLNRLGQQQEVCIITARRLFPAATAQTRRWMDQHGLDSLGLMVCEDKKKAAEALDLDFYLDDLGHNLVAMLHSPARLYLLTRPYNDTLTHPDIARVATVDGFLACVEKEAL